jgi:predicted MFS family arabinose efflux permease
MIGVACFTLFIAAMYQATGKTSDIGFISVATVGPGLLIVLFAGSYTARLSPLGTARLFTASRALLFTATGLASPGPTGILIAAALQSLIHQGLMGAKMSLDADLVPEAQRRAFNARKAMLASAATVSGPPLGGVILAALGFQAALFCMAGLSALAALLLSLVRAGDPGRRADAPRASATPMASLLHLWRAPRTASVVAMFCLVSVILEVQAPLMFPFVREVHGRGSDYTGLLLGLCGIGGIAGAYLAQRFPRALGERSVPWVVAADGVIFLIFTQLREPDVGAVLFVFLGMMSAITLVIVESAVQRDIESRFRPFVFSVMQFAAGAGGASLGIVTAFLAEGHGAQPVLAIAAMAETGSGLLCLVAGRLLSARGSTRASTRVSITAPPRMEVTPMKAVEHE